MIKTFNQYLNENKSDEILKYISDKPFKNKKSKSFLFHGTKINPKDFSLKDDYNWEDSNTWSGDLPEGYIFLTTDVNEAFAYGKYVIPCELKKYDNITFKFNNNNPSQIFDRDYGIDLYTNDESYNFWEKFENSNKSSLIIKGTSKSTVITYVENVIPRTDIVIDYFK